MSANMFDALAEEPVAAPKAAAAAAAPKPAAKAPVGGLKKSDVPKRDNQASSSQATTSGHLLGEVRKDTTKGPRHKHAPRTTAEGKIRGREFDRHSGTGRPANENKRHGGGSRNWGNVKDAQADHEAVASVSVEALEGVPTPAAATTEASVAPIEGAEATTEAKVEVEEPKTQSFSSFKAERAKKQKELESALGLGPRAEAREVKAAWYKPEAKSAATAAAPAKATPSSATKEQKQAKKYVPVSAIVGEVRAPRSDDHRGPRRERSEGGYQGGNREGGHREGGNREGGHREGGHREGGHREGGNREGGRGQRREGSHNKEQGARSQGPRGGKQSKTFDATADSNSLPALGQ